jgi:hypothetical protein
VAALPWFVGAWRRRSIAVPGTAATEPCEAWWLQTSSSFIDVRVTRVGHEDNGLPYSSNRAFGGQFDITDDQARWHREIDTGAAVPHTDIGSPGGLYIDADDPHLMIEDAPDRFVEEWVRHQADPPIEVVHTDRMIAIRIGPISGVVFTTSTAAPGAQGLLWLPEALTPLRVG